jgi:hypothetical protein
MVWCYTIWCDVIRYDMIWYVMVWCDMIRCDTIRYDMIWYDAIRYNTMCYDTLWYDMIHLLTAIGLTPGGSSTVHIYTKSIHRTTQSTILVGRLSGIRTQSGQTNWEECGLCPVFVSYTLAFALQLKKKHRKTSIRVAEEFQLARWRQNIQNRTYSYITIKIHNLQN